MGVPFFAAQSISLEFEEEVAAHMHKICIGKNYVPPLPPSEKTKNVESKSKVKIEDIIALHKKGFTQSQIAELLGCHRTRISQLSSQNGISLRKNYEIGGNKV